LCHRDLLSCLEIRVNLAKEAIASRAGLLDAGVQIREPWGGVE